MSPDIPSVTGGTGDGTIAALSVAEYIRLQQIKILQHNDDTIN